jgi:hypothetical protein
MQASQASEKKRVGMEEVQSARNGWNSPSLSLFIWLETSFKLPAAAI